MKILTYTTLYPNECQPRHGIFVEQRLRHLLKDGKVESRVLAPVPWFPFKSKRFGNYAKYTRVPKQEIRHNINILHPRYPVIPKVGMTTAPLLMAMATLPHIKQIIRQGFDFDVLDAHYFYPDGVAATIISRIINKPLTITARGTDISLIPKYRLPRSMILWAAEQAQGIITVCEALRDELVEIGADGNKISALRNGVDLELFHPLDREKVRRKYAIDGPTLVSVGHLIERKGHHLIIEAMKQLPAYKLLIVGDGEELASLQKLANDIGVHNRVRFMGALSHEELAEVYSASDALVLASSREGWANVLLESMACGTPVVATAIWGTPEVITTQDAGVLAKKRTVDSIVNALKTLFSNYPDRSKTRRYAEQYSWDATSAGLEALFSRISQ